MLIQGDKPSNIWTSEHQQMIREKVVEYMRIEKDFFRNFIIISDEWVGDNDDESAHQSTFAHDQLGTWGGDPEIQACVEIYNRPINLTILKKRWHCEYNQTWS